MIVFGRNFFRFGTITNYLNYRKFNIGTRCLINARTGTPRKPELFKLNKTLTVLEEEL